MTMVSRLLSGAMLTAMAVCAAASEQPGDASAGTPGLEWIRVSDDKTHFVGQASGRRLVIWGVNYDHDEQGRLIEDYWHAEWAKVAADFAEIKALDANVVRVHLQLAKFMDTAEQPNAANLARLGELVGLAERTGLYLDLTGLGCYHKQDVPAWYDALDTAARWDVQARFWRAVAGVCKDSPAVFCYDLMNEPILPGEKKKETEWLAGELAGNGSPEPCEFRLDWASWISSLLGNTRRGRTDETLNGP